MRDQLSELRRGLWEMVRALDADIAECENMIAAAGAIVETASGRDLEQVYTAQHRLHGLLCTRDALLACRKRLRHLLVVGDSVDGVRADPARRP